jgi:ABC-type transport system involved in Fe-S cluster assembly fused permease/ATPase subunit
MRRPVLRVLKKGLHALVWFWLIVAPPIAAYMYFLAVLYLIDDEWEDAAWCALIASFYVMWALTSLHSIRKKRREVKDEDRRSIDTAGTTGESSE